MMRLPSDLVYVDNTTINFEPLDLYPVRENKGIIAGRDVAYIAEGVMERRQAVSALRGFPDGSGSALPKVQFGGIPTPLTTLWADMATDMCGENGAKWFTDGVTDPSILQRSPSTVNSDQYSIEQHISDYFTPNWYKTAGFVDTRDYSTTGLVGSDLSGPFQNLSKSNVFCLKEGLIIPPEGHTTRVREGTVNISLSGASLLWFVYKGIGQWHTTSRYEDDWEYGIRQDYGVSSKNVSISNVPGGATVRLYAFIRLEMISWSIDKDGYITNHCRQTVPRYIGGYWWAKTLSNEFSLGTVSWTKREIGEQLSALCNTHFRSSGDLSPAPVATKYGSYTDKRYIYGPFTDGRLVPCREFVATVDVKFVPLIILGNHTP